ncbi:MAG: hypothetical protein FJ095_00985 [Deltaproteobacteria bacterium]|nr:hypothetical protein [Deltaproteobacteria bacterium]
MAGGRAPLATALALALATVGALAARAAAADDATPPPEAPIVTLRVPGDQPVEVVEGPPDSSRVIVYLHGLCGDPLAFRSWSSAAARFGTLISLRGDERCPDAPGRMKWSYNHDRTNRRISAAIKLIDDARRARGAVPLDGTRLTAIGYSQGAKRVEWLAGRFPERFVRVAMVAGAFKPSPWRLSRHARFLIVGGALDERRHLVEGRDELARAGLTVRYLELPKARHGEYGPEGHAAMTDALVWLFKNLP